MTVEANAKPYAAGMRSPHFSRVKSIGIKVIRMIASKILIPTL